MNQYLKCPNCKHKIDKCYCPKSNNPFDKQIFWRDIQYDRNRDESLFTQDSKGRRIIK